MNTLWTKNFSIITIGSIVSMLGNAVAGFAIGLLVLEKTDSTFFYALFMIIYSLPKIITPLIAGPFVDKFQRKKIIYTLDFISSAIFIFIYLLIQFDFFSYPVLLAVTFLVGCVDGIYSVAYESFYPNLISKGNFRKAYSISSMIYPLAAFMTPVAATVYNVMGTLAPLFLFNAITFFIAAICETRIDYDESNRLDVKFEKNSFSFEKYTKDLKEGIDYIKSEKALLIVTCYFVVSMMTGGIAGTLLLPFFRNNPQLFSHIPINVITLYSILATISVMGRLMGGAIHYKFKYPAEKKFLIAITVYASICILEMAQLYLPVSIMAVCFFITGILGVTSFNIRISATQSYIPDEVRGRFNGVFQMATTVGSMLGQLIGGVFGEFVPERSLIVISMAINLVAIFLIMYRGRGEVKKLYNREV